MWYTETKIWGIWKKGWDVGDAVRSSLYIRGLKDKKRDSERRYNILRSNSSNLGLSINPKQHNKNKFTLGKVIIYLQKSKSRDQHLT